MGYSKEYSKKVKKIREAIEKGHKFYIDTAFGRYELTGITEEWAFTGKDLTLRRWAIASTDVDRWYDELIGQKSKKRLFRSG